MHPFVHIAAIATLAAASSLTAWAAEKATQAQQDYQKERAHCNSGRSQQDRATCLKEAQAAYQETRRGGLNTQGDAQLSANATDRCRAQPEADRAACVARGTGTGTSDGSVHGGGIIHRTETRVP